LRRSGRIAGTLMERSASLQGRRQAMVQENFL
jgi:hypothetical protein